jgi:hypothetical protein
MELSYVDLLGDGKRHQIKASLATEHSLSSYGQPVLLLEDGQPLNYESWVLLNYKVEKATKQELEMLNKWLRLLELALM